ncbi:MAG: TIGR02996 domain-containing protein [Archangiaceae bacterium]|nr:TIGR02996 domain-containing protein [Archangiaceae bacterium]
MFLAEQHELLLQIIEHPDDDQLRLVLADRLNEQSDPLGELITVQCALERMVQGRAQGDWRALKAREAALVRRHGSVWHQSAAPFARGLTMKRGLPHTLRCSADALLVDGGLTVLAPIEQLNLEHVDYPQLRELVRLPLLQRVRALSLPDLGGPLLLGRLELPRNIVRLSIDGAALQPCASLGLLEHVSELELRTTWLMDVALRLLELGAAPRLERLAFAHLHRRDTQRDPEWRAPLERLCAARPGLAVEWRGIEYHAGNIGQLTQVLEPDRLDEAPLLAASHLNREPFGDVVEAEPFDRALPSRVEFVRLEGGALMAKAWPDRSLGPLQQPLQLDALTHLMLPPDPHLLEARAFDAGEKGVEPMRLRYESWPSRSLFELQLPVSPEVALALVQGIARGLVPLRAGLLRQGLLGWPGVLTLDEVRVGHDGAVKLMAPFRNCTLPDERREQYLDWLRPLGHPLDPDLEGTDDGALTLLGDALLHLLAGVPVSRRLRPSAIAAEHRALDPLAHGCLSSKRAERLPGIDSFFEVLNRSGPVASQLEVASAMRERQSSST